MPDPLEWRTHGTGQGPADKLIEGYQIGENGLLKQLAKALVERAMNAELTHHLGYEKNDPQGRGSGNSRKLNGSMHPALQPFATRAWIGLAGVLCVAPIAYALSYWRISTIADEPDSTT